MIDELVPTTSEDERLPLLFSIPGVFTIIGAE
jgi:hypothetical protein